MEAIQISSIGIVGPNAVDTDTFRKAIYSAPAKGTTIVGQAAMETPVLPVDDATWNHGIPGRALRRLDRFTQLAIYAANQCVEGCPVSTTLCADKPYEIGLCIGNNYGGWTYVEPMMRPLYETGMKAINPYVATAWFPAAAQGEISIRLGLKGTSKTFAAERLSSACAIEYAALLVANGTVESMLAGGVESPLTPAVLRSMQQSELISTEVPAGEAACVFSLQKATASSGKPLITGFGRGRDPITAITQATERNGITPADLSLVLLDGPRGLAHREHCRKQLDAIAALRLSRVPVAQCQPFGETVGAAFAVQMAVACTALQEQRIPVSTFCPACRFELENYGFQPQCNASAALSTVAVLGSDAYGQWMCALVSGNQSGDLQ